MYVKSGAGHSMHTHICPQPIARDRDDDAGGYLHGLPSLSATTLTGRTVVAKKGKIEERQNADEMGISGVVEAS